MEFVSYIVNELGEAIYKCSELSDVEELEILINHPEYRRVCLEV